MCAEAEWENVMGLKFYPQQIPLPEDHCIHKHLQDLPDRFIKQKLLKNWTIEGPFHDEDGAEYCFFLIDEALGSREKAVISESDLLFDEKAVNRWISKLIARCSEIELSSGIAQRLMGKKAEEVNASEGGDIIVVEDFVRGKGRVIRRSPPLENGEALPEKSGSLILPSR